MSTIPLSFRTETDVKDRLDACAEALGRNRNWVINEAIEDYLALNDFQIERIRKGRASTTTFTTDEVRERIRALHAKRTAK